MGFRYLLIAAVAVVLPVPAALGQTSSPPDTGQAREPFVYTQWESFTTESTGGQLINDHIFFLAPDGDSLWIGTEGGLVLYHEGTWKSWTEEV